MAEDAPLPLGKLPAALLRELLAAGPPPPEDLRLPPAVGEDACVIQVAGGALVAATDPITLTGHGIGAHAVVVNANDVAVLGVRPRWFLACVLLPAGTREAEVRAVFEEMRTALAGIDAALVGGHTEVTGAVTQTVVVGQMLGLREDGRFVRTGGVQATDIVLQIGPAPIEGAAVLAREAGERLRDVPEALLERARAALRDPGISVVDAALRAADLGATALHDPTEGGLSAGLHELAEASGLALRVDVGSLLWFEPGLALCDAVGADPWGVLASGTLLAAFPAASAEAARDVLAGEGYAVGSIARAEPGVGVCRADGSRLPRHERDELSRVLGADPA
ncbi:MAG: AIR synthase related protein [Myxococcales bacterium]|nr:AIR synthase related protein [Myxococcales bacterium]